MNANELLQMIADLVSGRGGLSASAAPVTEEERLQLWDPGPQMGPQQRPAEPMMAELDPGPSMPVSPREFEFAPGFEPDTSYAPSMEPESPAALTNRDLEKYRGNVFSDVVLDLGSRFGYTSNDQLRSYLPQFNRIALEEGNSAEFQRQLYRQMTGREAPQNYTGFHASQADRITNVFSPDDVDINAMQEIAFIASALREMTNAGHHSFENLEGRQVYQDTWDADPLGARPGRRGFLPGSVVGPGYR